MSLSSETALATLPTYPLFKIIDAHASLKTSQDSLACDGETHVDFQVTVPNFSVTLVFKPQEFFDNGSKIASRRFYDIRKRAIDDLNFDEADIYDLLLPFMRLFREEVPEVIPRHDALLTLRDIEYRGCWELTCSYTHDEPTLQHVEHIPKPHSFHLELNSCVVGHNVPIIDMQNVYLPKKMGNYSKTKDLLSFCPPQKVRVNHHPEPYFYHPITTSPQAMQEEIDEHVKICSSGLSYHDMRILPLCGVIIDDDEEVIGVLKEWQSTYDEDSLEVVLSENEVDNDDLKSWVAQFDNAVAEIQKADLGFVPKVWDVAVNKRGEVWIVYLKDGRVPIDGSDMPNWTGRGMPGMHHFLKCLEPTQTMNVVTRDDNWDLSSDDSGDK